MYVIFNKHSMKNKQQHIFNRLNNYLKILKSTAKNITNWNTGDFLSFATFLPFALKNSHYKL